MRLLINDGVQPSTEGHAGIVKLRRQLAECGPMTSDATSYHGYRFPPEIISRCVWLYYRFGVSLRDVSELMLARGIELSTTFCLLVSRCRRGIRHDRVRPGRRRTTIASWRMSGCQVEPWRPAAPTRAEPAAVTPQERRRSGPSRPSCPLPCPCRAAARAPRARGTSSPSPYACHRRAARR